MTSGYKCIPLTFLYMFPYLDYSTEGFYLGNIKTPAVTEHCIYWIDYFCLQFTAYMLVFQGRKLFVLNLNTPELQYDVTASHVCDMMGVIVLVSSVCFSDPFCHVTSSRCDVMIIAGCTVQFYLFTASTMMSRARILTIARRAHRRRAHQCSGVIIIDREAREIMYLVASVRPLTAEPLDSNQQRRVITSLRCLSVCL